ncbi:zinc-dependent alcohol dehydrogenase [Nonomuraea gerenzanensis]|uniref:Threonine dehydrogenase and related Zn-dependent dehydrogenases n=1 Tax=Nonomuraea gerenzanensis TaxID=93944 RepID=A0A1M4E5N1_9ACTN|nr:zinc-dependent alcohol dehydrogenase [Nonomuraea gerenzanensis]UBU16330.1 glutathione-dependent formaldehyde dehydrogenase [Nonomuraea gerenzanensis]SBO94149.1 Threonine dehydrogenase and related Zn-dependent dehydrogenases [Nonomuraea gerenzanensis]
MKALCWTGVNEVSVEDVPDPGILNRQDAVVRVTASSVCGSDLHLLDGYVPTMAAGDVLGHEFVGEIVEVGSEVRERRIGERVTVCSIIGCGRCHYCRTGLWSLCDNTNPNPGFLEKLNGHATAGIFGYSHAMGGFAGSHAEYVRVPYADVNAFPVPEGVPDSSAVFASDAVPTGWMGADLGEAGPGKVVAVWGCGGVGQMAALASLRMGAERVIAIDRFPERLAMAAAIGAETLNYEQVDVLDALKELTGGRGPDVCVEAVGMESHGTGFQYAYDRAKQSVRLQTDRGLSLRQAIHACRKGGIVSVLGVYLGLVDKFPMGAVMNKGLTLRSGQQHGHRYIPMILDRMSKGEIDASPLLTHPMSLRDGPTGYELFKNKRDGCVRAVFQPTT